MRYYAVIRGYSAKDGKPLEGYTNHRANADTWARVMLAGAPEGAFAEIFEHRRVLVGKMEKAVPPDPKLAKIRS